MKRQLKTIGITAEYNPFHNGHRYQIEEIRRQTGAEKIIVVMGGYFLQRGIPAFTDKYLRTEMALSCGADLVFELPTVFSTASAEYFAFGGVSLLHQLGCVDGICFGSECGDLAALSAIADYLVSEPEDYVQKLRSLVSEGVSYPAARSRILLHTFPEIFSAFPDILTAPNNILAIEYLKAVKELDSPLMPFTVRRNDHGYHAERSRGEFLSASSIREMVLHPQTDTPSLSADNSGNFPFSKYIPPEVDSLLSENRTHFPVTADDFSEYLFYALNTLDINHALALSDMSRELWHRIQNKIPDFRDFTSFTECLRSKQYTHSRISRLLCHILLDIRRDYLQSPFTQQKIPALYGRILGIRAEKSALLRNVDHFPLINKLADTRKILEQYAADKLSDEEKQQTFLSLANAHLQVDLRAAALYRRSLYCKNGTVLPEEHRAGVIRY